MTEPKGAQSLARFTFTATFETAAEVPPPALEDGTGGAHAPERSIQTITKMLRVAGVLTRDTFRRPTSAEVTEVLALPGDPGLEAWRARRTGWTLGDTAFQSNLLKTIADAQRLGPLADPAWLRTQTQLQKAVADFKTPLDTGALANVQKMFDNIQNPLDAGALANIQKMLDNIQMGPTMRAIADAQKLIGQAHLNPIITSALEAARRAELARRSAESEEETNDTGDRGDGDPNEPESGHHTGGDDEHDPPDA